VSTELERTVADMQREICTEPITMRHFLSDAVADTPYEEEDEEAESTTFTLPVSVKEMSMNAKLASIGQELGYNFLCLISANEFVSITGINIHDPSTRAGLTRDEFTVRGYICKVNNINMQEWDSINNKHLFASFRLKKENG
jgi:hypothetical protein